MRALALSSLLVASGCLDFDSLAGLYHPDAAADASQDAAVADLAASDLAGQCPGSGTISFISQSTVTQGQPLTESLTLLAPPQIEPCDLLILMFYTDDNSAIVDPPGWNRFLALPDSNGFQTHFYTRIVGDAEPATYEVMMNPAQYAVANIVAYRGVDGSIPLDSSLLSVCHTSPTSLAGFSPASPNDQVLVMCICDTGFGEDPAFIGPANMLLRSNTNASGIWDGPEMSGMAPMTQVSCQTSSDLCCVELALVPAS